MTKHEKIFKAFFSTFHMTPLNEEIDEFQDKLKEQGLEIVESKTIRMRKDINKLYKKNGKKMIDFIKTKNVIDVYKESTYLGNIFLSLNYEKYYFNPSGIAISESQLTTILEKMRKLNNELTNLSGE